MRKFIIFGVVGFVICTAFTKQNPIITNDYRDAYTGTYFCKQSNSQRSGKYNQEVNISSSDTNSIIVIKDVLDSILQINVGKEIIKVKLRNKTLQAFPSGGHYKGNFYSTDSINFYFASSRAISCSYKGKKK